MQVMDEEKRSKILAAATKLFATQPFHKVLLSDVAEIAAVSKGSLYTYFKNKDDLYFCVLYHGVSSLIEQLGQRIQQASERPLYNLKIVVHEMVGFAYDNPHQFEVMRTIPGWGPKNQALWDAKRTELIALIESIIQGGIDRHVFMDPHPELTALYIAGMVRFSLIEGIETVEREILIDHILWFIESAIKIKEGRI